MRSTKITVSLIIPLYNEEKRFPKSFPKIDSFFTKNKISIEYILVDDGSSDNTFKIINRLKSKYPIKIVRNKKNLGKGASLKKAVSLATGKYTMFTDADLSTPIEEFSKLFPELKKNDIVIGSRRLHNSDIKIPQPIHRKILGAIFYFIFSTLFTKEVKDTNCGFKMYKTNVAKDIYGKSQNKRWGFDAEIIYLAIKYNYKIAEVPVIWLNDPFSRVSTIGASALTLKELAMIKINDWTGKYNNKSIIQKVTQTFFTISFKILFTIIGKPQTDADLSKAVELYKGGGFGEIFSQIRVWDSPFAEINKLVPKNGTVLDLGSGDGLLSNYLAISSARRKVFGFEINKSRLSISDRGIKNTKFKYADLTKLEIPSNSCILLVHVLHHLPSKLEQEKLLKKCHESMTKKSKLVIVEIAEKPIIKYTVTWLTDMFVVPMLFEKKLYDNNFHYRKTLEWQMLLKEIGFKTKKINADKNKPFSHIILVAEKK